LGANPNWGPKKGGPKTQWGKTRKSKPPKPRVPKGFLPGPLLRKEVPRVKKSLKSLKLQNQPRLKERLRRKNPFPGLKVANKPTNPS